MTWPAVWPMIFAASQRLIEAHTSQSHWIEDEEEDGSVDDKGDPNCKNGNC